MTDPHYDYIVCGGGTSGCVVAARLAEDPSLRILLVEAGAHNENLENVHMVGGWSKNFDTPQDWNIVTEPTPGIDNRQVKVSRGRFLGGSSGVNGTLCIRGTEQDYDDWELEGWSGKEMFEAMKKVSMNLCSSGSALTRNDSLRHSITKTGSKPIKESTVPMDPSTLSLTTWHQSQKGCLNLSKVMVCLFTPTCLPQERQLKAADMLPVRCTKA